MCFSARLEHLWLGIVDIVPFSITIVCVVYPSPPPPLTRQTAVERPAAPTHTIQSAGPANTGPRRTATEDKGRVRNNGTNRTVSNHLPCRPLPYTASLETSTPDTAARAPSL